MSQLFFVRVFKTVRLLSFLDPFVPIVRSSVRSCALLAFLLAIQLLALSILRPMPPLSLSLSTLISSESGGSTLVERDDA